ncbi:hypothetical protein ACWCQL_37655 [Streptomyces sp. NPDC002073]
MTQSTTTEPTQRELATVREFVVGRAYGIPITRPVSGGGVNAAAPTLSRRLGLPAASVAAALRVLLRERVLYETRAGYLHRVRRRSSRHEACLSTIRARIKNGHHRSGDALPVGLFARDFALHPKEVDEICTALRDEGLVTEQGPHGPGYYVV